MISPSLLRRSAVAITLWLVCAFTNSALSAEVRTTVKYVSSSTVYLDAGRKAGVQVGDRVEIRRVDEIIATLSVTFVADNSASCKLADGMTGVQAGDSAIVQVAEAVPQANVPDEGTAPVTPSTPADGTRPRRSAGVNRLSGSIGLDYTLQDDREEFNYDYTQPSLRVRTEWSRIGGSWWELSLRMRARKTIRDRETSSATQTATSHRIYEAALRYDNPDAPLSYGAGRLLARELRGIGYIDGAFVRYKATEQVSAGAFGGTEPDLENTDFQTDVTKTGVFVAYENKLSHGQRLAGTLSFAGSYNEGEISREFLYQQFGYSHGTRFSVYESGEININRDWLKDAEGSSLKLASLLFNARYAPTRSVAFSLSFDNREPYYTYESRSVPDSLFDDALRQSLQGSVNLDFTRNEFAEIGGSLRTTEGNSKDASSEWLRLGCSDLLNSRIGLTARVRVYESEYSSGYQPSVQVVRSLLPELRMGVEVGTNTYDLELSGESVEQQWLRLTADAALGRHVFASVDAEAARGSGRDANIMTFGVGYRF